MAESFSQLIKGIKPQIIGDKESQEGLMQRKPYLGTS